MMKKLGAAGLIFLIIGYLVRRSVGNVNPRVAVNRRQVVRRGTRGCGRAIRRGRGVTLSSLRDEAVRMLSYTGRDLSTLKDVRRRLYETVSREGLFTAEGRYVPPDQLVAADVNRTIENSLSEALSSGEMEDEIAELEMNWEQIWVQDALSKGRLLGTWGRSRLWWEYRFRLWAGLELPLPQA